MFSDPKATGVPLQGLLWGTQQVLPCRPVPTEKKEREARMFFKSVLSSGMVQAGTVSPGSLQLRGQVPHLLQPTLVRSGAGGAWGRWVTGATPSGPGLLSGWGLGPGLPVLLGAGASLSIQGRVTGQPRRHPVGGWGRRSGGLWEKMGRFVNAGLGPREVGSGQLGPEPKEAGKEGRLQSAGAGAAAERAWRPRWVRLGPGVI